MEPEMPKPKQVIQRQGTREHGFGHHDNQELVDIFENQKREFRYTFQGKDPRDAKVVFISLDANFTSIQQNDSIPENLRVYLNNAEEYIDNYGGRPLLNSHHPYMAIRFHNRLRSILRRKDDEQNIYRHDVLKSISFVELLWMPTYGNSTGYPEIYSDMVNEKENMEHLSNLDHALAGNPENKTIVVFKPAYDKIRNRILKIYLIRK